MKINIDTREFRQFEKDLQKLPNKIATKVLQNSVTSAIRVGMKEIKASAPVHTGDQSEASKRYGTLKSNIRARKAKAASSHERSAYVSTGNAFWGNFLEYGTRYIPARPWFAPAFERAKNAMLDALEANLEKRIKKEFDGLGK
jgi:HK97 gp10 family phage protein